MLSNNTTEVKSEKLFWLRGILISIPVFLVLFLPVVLGRSCGGGLECLGFVIPSAPFLIITYPLIALIEIIFRDPDYLQGAFVFLVGFFGFFYFLFLGGLIGWLIDDSIRRKNDKIFITKVIFIVIIGALITISLLIINSIIPKYPDKISPVNFSSSEECHQGLVLKIDNIMEKMKKQAELNNPGYRYSFYSSFIVYSPILKGCIYQYHYNSSDSKLNEYTAPEIESGSGVVEYNTGKILYKIEYNFTDDREEILEKKYQFDNKFNYYWSGSGSSN